MFRNGKQLNDFVGTWQSFTDEKVKPNTEYTYAVRAFTVYNSLSKLSDPVTIVTNR